jgi:hypothetical protein
MAGGVQVGVQKDSKLVESEVSERNAAKMAREERERESRPEQMREQVRARSRNEREHDTRLLYRAAGYRLYL